MTDDYSQDFGLLIKFINSPDTNNRTLAIVCVSYAEKYLGELIKSQMKGLNHDLREKLFKPEGLLGPMAARIDIAKALGIIDATVFADLRTLASIRNKFAHNLEIDTFDHPEIAKRVDELRLGPETLNIPDDVKDWLPEQFTRWTKEERFRFTAVMLCSALHSGMYTLRKRVDHSAKDK